MEVKRHSRGSGSAKQGRAALFSRPIRTQHLHLTSPSASGAQCGHSRRERRDAPCSRGSELQPLPEPPRLNTSEAERRCEEQLLCRLGRRHRAQQVDGFQNCIKIPPSSDQRDVSSHSSAPTSKSRFGEIIGELADDVSCDVHVSGAAARSAFTGWTSVNFSTTKKKQ